MIGDTPNSDIIGANKVGFVSILVKTGNYVGGELSKDEKPTHLV